jgi:hypothetical protein
MNNISFLFRKKSTATRKAINCVNIYSALNIFTLGAAVLAAAEEEKARSGV